MPGTGARTSTLTIPEEVLLLRNASLGQLGERPKRERDALGNSPIAAGRLIELILAKRITVGSGGRVLPGTAIHVTDEIPTGDELLDDVLQRLATSRQHDCSYWIEHVAKGSELAYWDRLIAKSLLRPGGPAGEDTTNVADADVVEAIRDRVRAVVANAATADLRDVALVTLLAHAMKLFAFIHGDDASLTAMIRRRKIHRSDERAGRQAAATYRKAVESKIELDHEQREWAIAAARAIELISDAAAPHSGPG